MHPTLKDIAQLAQVSTKTVSRVINQEYLVRETTRKKVKEIIHKLGYQPNDIARSLKQKKTHTIGYIIPDISNPFFGMVGKAIEQELRMHGYSLLIGSTNNDPVLEKETLKLLVSKKVDGIIFATLGKTRNFLKKILVPFRIPVVIIDNKIPGLCFDTVLHDNESGAFLLTQHLLRHGHRDIAFIGGPLTQTSGFFRMEGYRKALQSENISYRETLIRITDWQVESGYRAALDLIESGIHFSAIFSANSLIALGILKAIRCYKMHVPQDVALVSFDGMDCTEVTEPPLTTIVAVEKDIGLSAVQLLLTRLEAGKEKNNLPCSEVLVPVKLAVRESCGCRSSLGSAKIICGKVH